MSSCFLLFQLNRLNMIPIVWVGLIVFVLLGFGFYLLLKHKVFGNILLVLILVVSSFGGFYVQKENVALENFEISSFAEAKFMVAGLKD